MTNRSVNGTSTSYTVNDLNQVSGYSGYTLTYDNNGNVVTNGATGCTLVYDDENRLVQWFVTVPQNGSPRTDFIYDGLGRLRKRLEWNWDDGSTAPGRLGPLVGAGGWVIGAEIRYIYDGKRVIQERNVNTPSVSYTRGKDLSGSLEGAGGIGGLLARSSGYSGGNWTSHAFYHADALGNVTYMINSSQAMVASYKYDPYGRTISSSGSLAPANVHRFSSKEIHVNSGLYYYLYRFYDPNTQRWLSRDPIGERWRLNLYFLVQNSPVHYADIWGLAENGDWGGTWWPEPSGGPYIDPGSVKPRPPIYIMPNNALVNPASGSGSFPAAVGGLPAILSPQYDPAAGAPIGFTIVQIVQLLRDDPINIPCKYGCPPGRCLGHLGPAPSAPSPAGPTASPGTTPPAKWPGTSGGGINAPPNIIITQ